MVINSYFDIIIDNCTFIDNKNFAALIHCDTSSYCDVTIKNSVFERNDGLCGDGQNIENGIYAASGAYGTISIESSMFIGIPWIGADSTSTITIDNETQSMISDTMVNGTNRDLICSQQLQVFVSNNRYVLCSIFTCGIS